MNIILVAAEGVIYDDDWNVNEVGRMLLLTLTKGYRVVVGLDHADVDRFIMWGRLEGIRGYEEVLPDIVGLRGFDCREAQIENLRARGFDVEMLVDSDPSRVARAMELGVNGLLFAHAKFMRQDFRPDFERDLKPWDSLVAEVNHQHVLEVDLLEQELAKQPQEVE